MKGKMNLECNKTIQPFQTFEDLDRKLFANKLMKYVIKALQNQQNLKFNLLQFLEDH